MGHNPADHQHVNEFGEPRFARKTVENLDNDGREPVVVSICLKCNKYIAATQDLKLLAAVEAAHHCYIPLPRAA